MFTALLLSLLAPARAEEVYMAELGVTADLPKGWSIPRWSDWDLDGVDSGETTAVHVESTFFEVPINQDNAAAFATLASKRLIDEGKGHSEITVVKSGIAEHGGARLGSAEVHYQWTFPVDGKMVHLSATAVDPRKANAEAALGTWFDAMKIEKPASPTTDGGAVETESGFGGALPSGWRAPVDAELGEVRKLAAKTGQAKIDPENCWVGIQPYATGDASLLLACQVAVYLGKVDSYSFAGIDQQVRERFFKDVKELGPATPIEHADRLSLLYAFPKTGDNALNIAVTPYDQGLVLTYAYGPADKAGDLDSGIREAVVASTFSGPDGGHHPVGVGAWIAYAAAYRPILLAGAAAPVLLFFGLLFFMASRSKPKYEDI
jgi:hypothetical protein